MGFFEDIFSIGEFVGEFVEEFVEVVNDSAGELTELLTDGAYEMIIKGNSDYKTSYEIKEMAQKKTSAARNRLTRKYDELETSVKRLNEMIEGVYKKKVALAEKLGMTVDKRGALAYRKDTYFFAPSYSYSPSINEDIAWLLGFREWNDIRGRKESAEEYLEDARDFEVEVSAKIAEVNRVIALLETLKEEIIEEERIIDALNDALKYNKSLDRTEVGRQLQVLIAEHILDGSGKRNEVYRYAVRRLRDMSG